MNEKIEAALMNTIEGLNKDPKTNVPKARVVASLAATVVRNQQQKLTKAYINGHKVV